MLGVWQIIERLHNKLTKVVTIFFSIEYFMFGNFGGIVGGLANHKKAEYMDVSSGRAARA